jgi:NADPH-dependent ferric siderophore reductase
MNRITKALVDTTTKVVFRDCEVTEIVDQGTQFRSIELTGKSLTKATWNVGDKIQIRTDPDGLSPRTYTPMSWDTTRGTTRLLAYAHGDGPGAAWVRALRLGTRCQFLGPRRSLKFDDLSGPVLFVGDETSFALVAAWSGQHPEVQPAAVLCEVADQSDAEIALDAVGVSGVQLILRDADDAHLDRLAAMVIEQLRANAAAPLCLTGRAQTIAALRRQIKDAGLADHPVRAKAYWDENRSGLD